MKKTMVRLRLWASLPVFVFLASFGVVGEADDQSVSTASSAVLAVQEARGWVLPLMRGVMTNNKLAPFLNDAQRVSGLALKVHYPSESGELMDVCQSQRADFMILSRDVRTEQLINICHYRVVASATNTVGIYVKKGAAESVKRVGVVAYTRASDLAGQELSGIEKIEYSDLPALLFALSKGEVDAVVGSPAIQLMTSPTLRDTLQWLRNLQGQGETVLLFSPAFAQRPESVKLIDAFTMDLPSGRALFRDQLGMGGWKGVAQ